ncbi:hypothetical protein AB0I28_08840 [Phytomonospora sp. NPDC050363]|uniref:hypothetical protein n=1 Tax=Phytomonospora sp. NPDC050363 TaxID=3155642 RepID=UPI0033D50E39
MSRVNIDSQAAKKLGRGIGDRLSAIIDDVAATHGERTVEEIEAELDRRMASAGVTGGSWRGTAEAIAAGETVDLRAP